MLSCFALGPHSFVIAACACMMRSIVLSSACVSSSGGMLPGSGSETNSTDPCFVVGGDRLRKGGLEKESERRRVDSVGVYENV